MTNCTSCGGAGVETKVIPEYEASGLGAPFTVILHDAVKVTTCTKCQEVIGTFIPDMEGLFHAVAFARALEPRKLGAAELKFMRKAMGWKAKEVSKTLGIGPSHLSRCEAGDKTLALTAEKFFRVCAILRTPDQTALAELDISKLVDMIEISSVWDVSKPLVFHFARRPTSSEPIKEDDDKWRNELMPLRRAG